MTEVKLEAVILSQPHKERKRVIARLNVDIVSQFAACGSGKVTFAFLL